MWPQSRRIKPVRCSRSNYHQQCHIKSNPHCVWGKNAKTKKKNWMQKWEKWRWEERKEMVKRRQISYNAVIRLHYDNSNVLAQFVANAFRRDEAELFQRHTIVGVEKNINRNETFCCCLSVDQVRVNLLSHRKQKILVSFISSVEARVCASETKENERSSVNGYYARTYSFMRLSVINYEFRSVRNSKAKS